MDACELELSEPANFTRASGQRAQTRGSSRASVLGCGCCGQLQVLVSLSLLLAYSCSSSPSQMHSGPSPGSPSSRQQRRPMSRAAPDSKAHDINGRSSSATFTTCLDIKVDGAIPIDKLESTNSVTNHKETAKTSTPAEPKRAPRKSKTDAIAALSASVAQEAANDSSNEDVGVRVLLRDGPPIPVAPAFDISTVKAPSPRASPSKPKERPFGLTDCPTFRPTPEQFKDPMGYIKSISENAKSYGMCKIVPPLGWAMPFVTDTETFRFKTRLQRLNSIEASSRAKVAFLESLYRFHKQEGNPRVSVPTINHKPLDLWLLRKEVQKLGGYDTVTKNKKWADLGRLLGYGGIPGLATQLKNSYSRVILPWENRYEQHVRNPTSPHKRTASNGASTGKTGANDDSPPSSPLTATSSPLSEPPDESETGRLRRSARTNDATPSARRASAAGEQGLFNGHGTRERPHGVEPHCEMCHKKDRGEEMLLCDGCDCGFHTFCLSPPLASIPKGQWYCHTCLFGSGSDFGFDEGEEHCLSSFQARDLEFRRLWFTSHPPSDTDGDRERIYDGDHHTRHSIDPAVNRFGDVEVSETDVEREFWRLVQSANETVEVEYGADVHSTTHGSGMPTMETHPLNSYSKDPWNLNNIPILPESLLRFIKSDISGMTVPWTYVGMVFSTFCWHNEDHYTYSINYMHWGETKTWYSIPGEDAGKFEAAIRREAPDLFEAQPDLLFQLVTLMNPGRLKDAGVEVYACNQRAGEFVVTFPKAYHAGFNHGLNFNEAVNFALPDWLPLGLDCARRYQEHKKLPVFSHDELIITITQQSQSIKTAIWLNESLQEMVDRELSARKRARALEMNEMLEDQDRPEEQYQCSICKVFCYLSQITCSSCPNKIVCIDHVDQICKCPKTSLVLRKRFNDIDLLDTQTKVAERAAIPSSWRDKLTKALSEEEKPQLRVLRSLLSEGDRISYPLPELHSLRKCVTRANEWVDAANSFLIRKPTRKRPRRAHRGRLTMSDVLEDVDKPDRTLEDLYALLKEVDDLGFECQEITALFELARDAEDTKAKAKLLLETNTRPGDRDIYIQECERLMTHGSTLNVHVEDLIEIEKLVLREQLLKELEQETNYETLSLEDVRMLVSRAQSCGLPSDNKYMKLLEARLRAGTAWEERARAVLEKPRRTLEELEEVTRTPNGVPIDRSLLESLLSARTRGKEIERQITAWMSGENSHPHQKPRVQDVVKLVSRGEKEFNIPVVADMRRTVDFAVDLETRCDSVLKNRYTHTEDTDIFQMMHSWKAYAKEHMTIFSLPNFERLEKQLTLHFRWVEGLPWYCRSHQAAHGKPVLDDVVESTRPEDDLPPTDEYFTCICTQPVRPPAPGTVSDAVQCDHCYARFHGVCAANGGSCPFCDHQHWNGTIHKERGWHFCYMPSMLLSAPELTKNYSEDWKQLEIIVHRVDRLCSVIGQFLSFASQPTNQRAEYIPQVRHYMRKLYKIQFAVSPNPELSFGLELAGLHRVLAGQPTNVRMKKRRRPKFTFGQDVDKDWADGTRCICRGRTAYLLNYPTVECEVCGKTYHGGCVFFPIDSSPGGNNRFMCPLCCLRKNRTYPYSEVRVKHIENPDPDAYVDTKEMLDTFSKDVIYMKMPPPYTQTLFVELIRFTPGQPDNMNAGSGGGSSSRHIGSGSGSSSLPIHRLPQSQQFYHGQPIAPRPPSPPTPYEQTRPVSTNGQPHIPPPPPWSSRSVGGSRWSSAAATAPPPTARSHGHDGISPTNSPTSRKRKYPDDSIPGPSGEHSNGPVSPTSQPSPKRRSTHPTPPMHPPTMPTPPMHPPAMHVPVHPAVMHPSMHPQALPPAAMMHPPHMQPPPHMSIMQHPTMVQQGPPPPVPMQPPVNGQPVPLPPMQPGVHTSPIQPLRTPPMQPMQAANARTSQGLSPSLAMMLSPNPADVATSPRQAGPQYPVPRANLPAQPGPGPARPVVEQVHIPPMGQRPYERLPTAQLQSPTQPKP